MEALYLLTEALIYPGLAFSLTAAFLTQWYVRKLYARMQHRIGPLHTGPSGLLQPIADFLKLMSKEDVVVRGAGDKLMVCLLSISIGALLTLLLMTPLASPLRYVFGKVLIIRADFDIILAIYLLIWPTLAFALAGFLSPNPLSIIGGSRVFSLSLVYEVALSISIITPIVLTSLLYGTGYSIYASSINSWRLWTGPYTSIPTAIAFITALLSLQCKLMEKPFDIPEAETEVVAGPFTEYSGPKLALIILVHDLKLYVGAVLITFIFLGGPAPFHSPLWAAALTFLVKYLLVVFILTAIKAAVARFRVDQALFFFWRYIIPLSLLSLVLAMAAPFFKVWS